MATTALSLPATPRAASSSALALPTPPPNFRVRRTIARTLFGAVFECEQPDDATTRRYSPPLPPLPPLRRRPSLAVKTLSLTQVHHATKCAPPHRAVDDPWQEWRVAEKLRAYLEATNAPDAGAVHMICFHHQLVLPDADTMVLISEYCDGGDLFSFLNAQPTGVVAAPTALAFIRQVALGLRFLHTTLGVAHRDLSLENVLLHNGVCKLADFALSVDTNQACDDSAGKEYYMAPEVVAPSVEDGDVSTYDPRAADVWSLGIMLFIMLTGSPLLEVAARGERGFAALALHGVVPVLCAWGVRDGMSDACADLLDRMLQVDPAKRPSVDDVLAHAALQLQEE